MANETDGAAPGQGEQHVVATLAVVVRAHGIAVRVGVGDHGGDVVEHGYGVQPLGQKPEPLFRRRVGPQHMRPALGGYSPGDDALLRWEVPELRASTQDAQMVRHGAHKAAFGELLKSLSQGGGRNAPKTGQFVHGGQGRCAQQQEGLFKTLAQRTQSGVRPQAHQIDEQLLPGSFNRSDVPADRIQDRGWHGSPHVAPLKKAPEGVAGHAEDLGCLPPSMPPHVGAHVVPDRPFGVRSRPVSWPSTCAFVAS